MYCLVAADLDVFLYAAPRLKTVIYVAHVSATSFHPLPTNSSAGIIDQARSLARHVLPTFCFHSILTEPVEGVGERTGDLLDRGERDDADRSDLGVPTEARGESNEIMSTRFTGPELASTLLIQHS